LRSAAAVSTVQCTICRSDSARARAQRSTVTCTGVARGGRPAAEASSRSASAATQNLMRPAVKAAQRSAELRMRPCRRRRQRWTSSPQRRCMHRNASRCNGERTVCTENVRHPRNASVHPPCRTQQRARQGTAKIMKCEMRRSVAYLKAKETPAKQRTPTTQRNTAESKAQGRLPEQRCDEGVGGVEEGERVQMM
jgi:hypothetical protein